MNVYLVEISICILCFNKNDQTKLSNIIFNWLIINFLFDLRIYNGTFSYTNNVQHNLLWASICAIQA